MKKFLIIQIISFFLIFNTSMSETKFLEGIFSLDSDKNTQAKILKEHKNGIYENSIKFFKKHAANGVVEAQYNLAMSYYHGMGVDVDFEKAAELYKIAAEKGNSTAQFALSIMYAQGQGVDQNMDEFFRLTKLAAKKKEPGAIYNLSQMYRFGDGGFSKDEKKTFVLCKEAADKGYVEAQTATGLMYALGKGTEENLDKAIKYFKLAAKNGSDQAKEYLTQLNINF